MSNPNELYESAVKHLDVGESPYRDLVQPKPFKRARKAFWWALAVCVALIVIVLVMKPTWVVGGFN